MSPMNLKNKILEGFLLRFDSSESNCRMNWAFVYRKFKALLKNYWYTRQYDIVMELKKNRIKKRVMFLIVGKKIVKWSLQYDIKGKI